MTTRRNTRFIALACTVAAFSVLAACGGDGDAVSNEAPTSAQTANDDENDTEQPDADTGTDSGGGFSMHSGTGTATVELNGETLKFATLPDEISVCTDAFGTLQVALPHVDDNGELVDGSELSLIALQPGIEDDDRRDVYVELSTPAGSSWVAGESGLASITGAELPTIDLRADGLTLDATVELISFYQPDERADVVIAVACDS